MGKYLFLEATDTICRCNSELGAEFAGGSRWGVKLESLEADWSKTTCTFSTGAAIEINEK